MRDFLLSRVSWLDGGDDRDVFLSSKARFVRNLDGSAFPWKSSRQDSEEERDRILDALRGGNGGKELIVGKAGELDPAETLALQERGLIGPAEFYDSAGGSAGAIAVSPECSLAYLINGANHLKIGAWAPGSGILDALAAARRAESDLEAKLGFAASLDFGYLSPRPEDCGSGLRLSVIAFIPGIIAAGVFDRVARDLLASGIEPRARAAGADAPADPGADPAVKDGAAPSPFIELSARAPMNAEEDDFSGRFASALRSLSEGERRTRERLRSRETLRLTDSAYRAAAVLNAARLLSFGECSAALGDLRAGIAFGLAPSSSSEAADPFAAIDSLRYLVAPGHIRLRLSADAAEEDSSRADLVRETLPRYDIG